MSMQQSLEDFGVQLAFAEANVENPPHRPGNHKHKGSKMDQKKDVSRRNARRKAYVYGAISLALYAVLYAKSQTIMTYFTKGHLFALLPVAAAFLFSYVHGTFTGNFWTALGVNASAKAIRKPTVEAPLTQQPTRRPRARAQM